MDTDRIDYKALNREVDKQVGNRKKMARWTFFGVSLLMFVVFTIISASIASGLNAPNGDLIGLMFMMGSGWFVSIVFQFISLMLDTESGEKQMRQQIAAQALSSELLRLGQEADVVDKPKREMTLTADGELEPVSLDSLIEEQKAQKRQG